MHTLKLRVNDIVYDKFIWLLSKFDNNEIEIISETSDFLKDQKYLAYELKEILEGKATFIGVEEAEKRLENIINNHENSI